MWRLGCSGNPWNKTRHLYGSGLFFLVRPAKRTKKERPPKGRELVVEINWSVDQMQRMLYLA